MSGLQLLETSIGLIFIYLILSLIATAITEAFLGFYQSREKNLRRALLTFFQESDKKTSQFTDKSEINLSTYFFGQPLYKSLNPGNDGKRTPSLLTGNSFIIILKAALDDLDPRQEDFEKTLEKIHPEPLRRMFLSIWKQSEKKKELFYYDIENWFKIATEKSRDWFKWHAFAVSFVVGFIIAVFANADTNRMITVITFDTEVRRNLIDMASDYTKGDDQFSKNLKANSEELYTQITTIQKTSVLGWKDLPSLQKTGDFFSSIFWCENLEYILQRIPGWIITVFAISIGAPFWFDLLHKLVGLRKQIKGESFSDTNPTIDNQKTVG